MRSRAHNARFDDINRHFAEIYKRFDRLETEYHMRVLEERLSA
jgi:hypothetical protein